MSMPRPNILVFHCHDLGDYLHCYGKKTVNSSHIDRFASEGVLLERYFCAAPQCSPARAALFTGRYPHANGVMGLCHGLFAWDLHPSEQHIGQILSAAGYRTTSVGIVHETRSGPERCGMQEHRPQIMAIQTVDETIKLLDGFAGDERPFYIQAGCVEPHRLRTTGHLNHGFLGDHLQPDASLGTEVPGYLADDEGTRQEIAELQGAVRHVDEQFGRLLRHLDSMPLAANTLVIFTTDHGIAMPRAKCSVYEPGLTVAMILRLPSRLGWTGGRRVRELLSQVDVMPTLLDIAGLGVPDNIQGRSFAPLLGGRPYSPRDAVFGEMTYHEYYDPVRSVRTERHKLILNFSVADAFMDCSQSWRPRSITRTPADPKCAYHPLLELYDLEQDPFEQNNLADEPQMAGLRGELLRRLTEHMRATHDPLLDGPVPDCHYRNAKALLS